MAEEKTLREIVDEDKSKRPMTKFIPLLKFEEYAPKFKQHFNLTKREDGVVMAEFATNGKELKWSLEQETLEAEDMVAFIERSNQLLQMISLGAANEK